MKATEECRPCLEGLLRQAAGLATEDPALKAKVIDEGLAFLGREFSTGRTSIAVATPLHRLVRDMTGNPDHAHESVHGPIGVQRARQRAADGQVQKVRRL